jgi:hypothetical protein
MNMMHKGLLLALLHTSLVCTLGAKLLYDRAYRPRVWVKVAPADPNLPIRGRYLALRVEVPAEGFSIRPDTSPPQTQFPMPSRCDLMLRDGRLTAVANQDGEFWVSIGSGSDGLAIVSSQTAFFLPEHAPDPSRRPAGEELWMEATIPRKGPPRPIRLGVKKNGVLTPLAVD